MIPNNSHRFSDYAKMFNDVPFSGSFSFQSARRRGYSQRLYFEFIDTQNRNGQAFFYTLTYNDKSIPKYEYYDLDENKWKRISCFCYSDIRKVTNGIISKTLSRQYGSKLRYFVACESGEGKGIRGEGANPHYHCIFFVTPLENSKVPYKKISPKDFKSLVLNVWQGADWIDFKDARFGIAKEGDNYGVVKNTAALEYVSKYVTKDNLQKLTESKIQRYIYWLCGQLGVTTDTLLVFYKYVKCFTNDQPHHLFYDFSIDLYNKWRKKTEFKDRSYSHWIKLFGPLEARSQFTEFMKWFKDFYINYFFRDRYCHYLNEYSGKVRCSKSLGVSGLLYVKDKNGSPFFQFPDPDKKVRVEPISMYYYRKLYYDTYTCDYTGNVLYRLNELGVQQHLNSIESRVSALSARTLENISICFNQNIQEFASFRQDLLLRSLVDSPNKTELIRFYSVYTLVYRYRSFHKDDMIALSPDYSVDSYKKDYKFFLEKDSFLYDYTFDTILIRHRYTEGYHSFDTHDCIKPYLRIFSMLDTINSSVESFRDFCSKQRWQEAAEHKKRLNAVKHTST